MSVPKDKRTEGELAINTEARRICTYVLRITGNDKKFPKEQEWFTNLLREKAIGIDLNCWKANNIYVNSQTLYDKRMALEAEAGDACTEILEIINIVKRERKKLARLVKRCRDGLLPRSSVDASYQAWRTHASKGNNYNMICRMDEYYKSLWAKGVNNGADLQDGDDSQRTVRT